MSLTGLALTTLAKEALLPIVQPILEEVLGQTATGIVGRLHRLVSDQNGALSLFLAQVTQAIEKYAKQYEKRHGVLKILGMREPISLDDIYTNVRFLNEASIRDFASTDALESVFRESNKRRFQGKCETRVGVEVASETQYLMVLGQPGAGKSTFLRRMGLEAFKGKKGELKQACIPVFLELKRFDNGEIDIQERITVEFETCGFPKSAQFVAKALEKGKLLILFDGLDEVPGKYVNGIIDKIQDFVDRYDQNRFIASCRTAAYRSGFRRFKDVVMADFDDGQIQTFIQNWFRGEEDQAANTADHCWELLQSEGQEGAKELAQTPLLLTFLCLVYDRSQGFASNRSTLYGKALRILLEAWAAEKRINRETIYDGLHTELEEVLLSEIAYENFIEDRLFFEKDELVEQIRQFLAGNLNAPKHLNSEQVLDAIAVQQGIFVERAENVYSFSHLTLQEYLTAQYVVDADCIHSIVEEYLLDQRWREVFLLVAISMRGKGADRFLNTIIETIEKLLEQPIYQNKLIPILLWSEVATQDASDTLSSLARRSLANAVAYAVAVATTYSTVNTNGITITISNASSIINSYSITYSIAYVNAIGNAIAIANAISNAIAYANTTDCILGNAYAIGNAYANTIANAITDAIKYLSLYYQELFQKEPVFTHLDIPDLLQKLRTLKQEISMKSMSEKDPQLFSQKLIKTILDAHKLPEKIIALSKKEARSIDNYYYATHLLIQCKEAAMRVSPEAWATIEERMLRVPAALRPDVEPN